MRFALMLLMMAGPMAAIARGDGGMVRLARVQGPYRVSVFTSPNPVRVGPVDISVLVQDAFSGKAVGDVQVSVRLGKSGEILSQPATVENATNKLFRAALFDVTDAGMWQSKVTVEGPRGRAIVDFDLAVEDALPRWWELVGWFVWPAVPIGLFAAHQWLTRPLRR